MPTAAVISATGSCNADITNVAMKPATMPLPMRSVIETSVRILDMHRLRLRVAPLGVKESVVTHQAHFRVRAPLAQFARGFDREQHRFRLGLVRAELFVGELDHPLVIALDEKVSGWRHAVLPVGVHSRMGYATRR